MSINFHAYQCRDYLLSDYEEIEKQWKHTFSDFQPERVMHILDLKCDENWLYIQYYETLFRLCLKNGTLEKQTAQSSGDFAQSQTLAHLQNRSQSRLQIQTRQLSSSYPGFSDTKKLYLNDLDDFDHLDDFNNLRSDNGCENGWSRKVYFNEAMVIYHLLYYVKDHPVFSGVWIPNTGLDTRAARNNQREDLLFTSFSKKFAGKLDLLEEACKKANGTPVQTKADIAYQFSAFPQVPLQLLFWDEDEDFPAQVQILVDRSVTDYIHLETTGCMISDLFDRLVRYLTV